MGNIFPLSQKPSCYEATIKLIEASFQYKKPHSFEIDFAPLIDKSNHHNCFILLDENENVLAHIGAKDRFLSVNNKKYPITLIGGIAVDEKRRGEGIFQTLFMDVLAEKRSDTTLFLLWSDLEKLYNKFGFFLCGTQFEFSSGIEDSPYIKTTYSSLNDDEKKQVRSLYLESFSKIFLTTTRDEKDWSDLAKVTSAELFLQKHNGKVESYYFQNKGQDLPGIIYEYGTKKEITDFIQEIGQYGKVWMAKELVSTENLQYQFFMSPGDLRLFSEFILSLTNQQFAIRNINIMKQEVYFDYGDETLSLETSDFLRGVFGPGAFEEIEIPTLYLSGLDSI
jgi:predicted GNAT family N-acyltransferase